MRWVVCILLAACARSAQPTLYTLSARDGNARPNMVGVIEVRTPHVAGYLDRHRPVLRVVNQRLELATNAQWAEPIDLMLARVLASDLAQRLPSAQVFSESGEVRTQPTLRVELDVRSFQIDDDQLVLDALLALRTPTLPDALSLEHVSLRHAMAKDDVDALAVGMSGLLAEVSEHVIQLMAQRAAVP